MINYRNRGKRLEEVINQTNLVYERKGIAHVRKQATPVKTIRGSKGEIAKAFYSEKTGLDYVGCIRGRYITFDCKSTNSKTSFPLSNIKEHQIKEIKKVEENYGLGFFIIYFKVYDEAFFVSGNKLIEYIEQFPRKSSIPIKYIKDNFQKIKSSRGCKLDYERIVLLNL